MFMLGAVVAKVGHPHSVHVFLTPLKLSGEYRSSTSSKSECVHQPHGVQRERQCPI